jgi:hypothetical protein
MATNVSARTLDELVDHLNAKARLFRSCWAVELSRLKAKHGDSIVAEALARLEQTPPSSSWDSAGHQREVSRAIDQLLMRRQQDPDNFPDDGVKV